MGFSQFAGTAIVPTVSRLVLGLAFVSIGWNKIDQDVTYTASEAAILAEYGLDLEADGPMDPVPAPAPAPAPTPKADDGPAASPGDEVRADGRVIHLAAWQEERTAPPEAEAEADADAEDGSPLIPASELAAPDESEPGAEVEPAEDPVVGSGPAWYQITLTAHDAGWPAPKWAGIGVALTELVGGGLILLGFLTRIWGLGLSVVMGSAIYLTSISQNGWLVEELNPLVFAQNLDAYKTLFLQLGLFTLAFGLFLTGAGPLSADRLFFGAEVKGERPPKDEVDAIAKAARKGPRPQVERE